HHHPNTHSVPTRRSSDLLRIRTKEGLIELPAKAIDEELFEIFFVPDWRNDALQIAEADAQSLAQSHLLQGVSAQRDWIIKEFARSEEHTSELQSPDHLVC